MRADFPASVLPRRIRQRHLSVFDAQESNAFIWREGRLSDDRRPRQLLRCMSVREKRVGGDMRGIVVALLLCPSMAIADQTVETKDGRQILLRDDGSYRVLPSGPTTCQN